MIAGYKHVKTKKAAPAMQEPPFLCKKTNYYNGVSTASQVSPDGGLVSVNTAV